VARALLRSCDLLGSLQLARAAHLAALALPYPYPRLSAVKVAGDRPFIFGAGKQLETKASLLLIFRSRGVCPIVHSARVAPTRLGRGLAYSFEIDVVRYDNATNAAVYRC
jgi:hypothetical protein